VATVHANGIDFRVNRYRIGAKQAEGPQGSEGAEGERPVVVFIHGLGIVDHSGLAFTLGMPLAQTAEVVLYALRGHGHSEVPPNGYRVVDHVADLVALLDALDLPGPVRLVGCSYGGAVAMQAAVLHPDRVAALFLIDPLVPDEGWTGRILPWMETAAEGLRGDYSIDEAMETLGLTSRRKAVAVADRAKRLLVGTTVIDDLHSERPFTADEYRGITCPVEAVFGTASMMYVSAGTLKDMVPQATLHTIAGVSHLEVFGRTAELGELIGAWAVS
jgi:pimeloyl-ACP methyl ester carboxylesterase